MQEPDDPEPYEQECLKLIREYYARPGNAEEMRANNARMYLGADLEEIYPYTRLVVRVRDEIDGSKVSISFSIWSDEWVLDVPGKGPTRATLLGVINIITANLDEPNRGSQLLRWSRDEE
jgi:hypothetical protein